MTHIGVYVEAVRKNKHVTAIGDVNTYSHSLQIVFINLKLS